MIEKFSIDRTHIKGKEAVIMAQIEGEVMPIMYIQKSPKIVDSEFQELLDGMIIKFKLKRKL